MAAKAARLVRLSRLFGSQEGPAKLNTPGKAELGPAGNAVLFRFGRKRRGKMLKKGAGVPGVCLGLGPGLAPFPGGSGVGAGRRQHHSHGFTPRAGGQEPPTLPTTHAGRCKQPVPGGLSPGGQILHPDRLLKAKKWDLEKARAVPRLSPLLGEATCPR